MSWRGSVLIEAAGKTWIVEEQELARNLWAGGDRFSGVTFRSVDYASDELYVRWVLRPRCLTRRLAEELFEIAGVRTWRDPRDSRLYELTLEASTSAARRDGRPTPLEVVRFSSDARSVETPWTLAKPLGWATDQELTGLLDRALRSRSLLAG
jgi:hypothetical protein